ncbi:tryptase-2-like, partial [Temnothorax curvispinosus]|uniref:Tryptase-2-like n=1 Tax=Temnothorax curvispinosus TaxID=300111 RepID=A0A6J1PJX9_9HYME
MGNLQGRHAEQSIMSPLSTKVLLCIVLCLSICQYTQSLYLGSESGNVTCDNPNDAIVLDANNDEAITNITEGSTTALKSPSFPYMVIVHQMLDGKYSRRLCIGTILSKRWVLTAAHCVEKNPGTLFVDFDVDEIGEKHIFTRVVLFDIIDKYGIGHSLLRFLGVLMIPTQAFIHPQYAKGYNDIALLYMPQDIPFSNHIQPVKLAYYESFVNKDAYVVGWRDNMASESMKLKYATLSILENNVCREYWPINDKHICTAADFGQFFCPQCGTLDCALEINSSPLIVRKNGQDFQIGIMSYGDQSCPDNLPRVYTKIIHNRRKISDPASTESSKSKIVAHDNDVAAKSPLIDVKHPTTIDSLLPEHEPTDTNRK